MALVPKLIGAIVVAAATKFGAQQYGHKFQTVTEAGNLARAHLDMGTILASAAKELSELKTIPADLEPVLSRTIVTPEEDPVPRDPWGSAYRLRHDSGTLILYSFGPDGIPQTGDDLMRERNLHP